MLMTFTSGQVLKYACRGPYDVTFAVTRLFVVDVVMVSKIMIPILMINVMMRKTNLILLSPRALGRNGEPEAHSLSQLAHSLLAGVWQQQSRLLEVSPESAEIVLPHVLILDFLLHLPTPSPSTSFGRARRREVRGGCSSCCWGSDLGDGSGGGGLRSCGGCCCSCCCCCFCQSLPVRPPPSASWR